MNETTTVETGNGADTEVHAKRHACTVCSRTFGHGPALASHLRGPCGSGKKAAAPAARPRKPASGSRPTAAPKPSGSVTSADPIEILASVQSALAGLTPAARKAALEFLVVATLGTETGS